MLGVGTSIWNRALAGKGAGDGGDSLPLLRNFTGVPSATHSLSDYGLTTTRTVQDYAGNWVSIPADADPRSGLNPVENLLAGPTSTLATESVTVTAGDHVFSHTGTGTVTFSGAYSGSLVGAGSLAFTTTAGTLTCTVTGSVTDAMLQNKTGRPNPTVADPYVSVGVGNGSTKGDNLVPNPTFDTDTEWAKGTGWSISGGVASCDGTQTGNTSISDQLSGVSVGDLVETTAEITVTAGTCFIRNGGTDPLVPITASGTYTQRSRLSGNVSIYVLGTPDFVGTVDNIDTRLGDPHHTGVDGFAYLDTDSLGNSVGPGWLDVQPGATNLADGTHDFSGGADTITLSATGNYTLSVHGTAAMTIAAGTATITGGGQATEGNPVTINCTSTGTVTLTLDSGTLDTIDGKQLVQLESGAVETPPIPSSGATSRATPSPYPTIDIPAEYVSNNESRIVVDGADVDIDDWDGVIDETVVGADGVGKVTDVKVYAPGERP